MDFLANFCSYSLEIFNSEPVHGIQNENLLHLLLVYDCSFSEDGFYYNLNSLNENLSRNDWDILKIDEKRYIANVTNVHIIGIGDTKLDETILSSELEVDVYNLVVLLLILKVRLYIVTKRGFEATSKVFLLTLIFLNLRQSHYVSYIVHPINQISF